MHRAREALELAERVRGLAEHVRAEAPPELAVARRRDVLVEALGDLR